jgi:hypothetical protein
MIQIPTYGDKRQLDFCGFCGGGTGTRDHCPSRVLLDEPYPENLPVVPACAGCNAGFSSDEQYLACLLACVRAGSTDPAKITRPKISRILSESPALRARLEACRTECKEGIIFKPESHRVSAVITKLAKGHSLFELNEPHPEKPTTITITPFALMSELERDEFESRSQSGFGVWPEVGSRAMQHLVCVDGTPAEYPWLVVQEGMYRFNAAIEGGISVRIVLQEYLACQVQWK